MISAPTHPLPASAHPELARLWQRLVAFSACPVTNHGHHFWSIFRHQTSPIHPGSTRILPTAFWDGSYSSPHFVWEETEWRTLVVVVLVTKLCLTLASPWSVNCQTPLWFPRQEYWSGLPFPSPGDLPDPGIEPWSPAWQADCLPDWAIREVLKKFNVNLNRISGPKSWTRVPVVLGPWSWTALLSPETPVMEAWSAHKTYF